MTKQDATVINSIKYIVKLKLGGRRDLKLNVIRKGVEKCLIV